ncbi:MAG: hypothetical protein IPI78_16055 [Chitinophagaceae bacterium]|nr:hypothetical protein [Chitinophagaceae bacterium]
MHKPKLIVICCGDDLSAKQNKKNTGAATRLEKAINYVSEDDADFGTFKRKIIFIESKRQQYSHQRSPFKVRILVFPLIQTGAYSKQTGPITSRNNNKDSALFSLIRP